MKKLIYIIVLLPILAIGQTQTENYIKTKTYKVATTTSIASPTITQANQSVTYFDGLGRPIQQVASAQSGSGKDAVTHIGYDAFGRQAKSYLPYISSAANLNYDRAALTNTTNFYSNATPATTGDPNFEATTNPYSETVFENSPLNRVLESAAQGNDWAKTQNHTVKFSYLSNIANEVKLYKVVANWNIVSRLYDIPLTDNGYYAANLLYKTITKNENWVPADGDNNTIQEFKNNEGQLILKRTFAVSMVGGVATNTTHDTYYIYDQFGNLTYIIPPVVNTTVPLTTTVLNNLCYQYKYDDRNRLAEKRIPSKDWEFFVYDKLNRPVASGPSYAPFTNLQTVPQTVPPAAPILGWMIVKYDVFNRPVYTGWMQSTTATSVGRKLLQDAQNSATTINESKTVSGTIDGIACYYTNTIAPTSFKLLSVNYYDNYTAPNLPPIPTTVESEPVLNTTQVKGLPTSSWVRVLTTSTSIVGETNTVFYDEKIRPIRVYTTNYRGGFTQTDSKLDFIGKTLYTITTHKRLTGNGTLILTDRFTYTNQDRLLTHTHQINTGNIEPITENSYNEFGQLIAKKVGKNPVTNLPLQIVNYSFNIRGWLKQINEPINLIQGTDPKDMFAFKINYNTVDNNTLAGVRPLYNGNISETRWRTTYDNITRSYGYSYDHLNRLTNAQFIRPRDVTLNNTPGQPGYNSNLADIKDTFNESLSYDKNGNIQSLQRKGSIENQTLTDNIDFLTYNYDSNNPNQLTKVTDAIAGTVGFADDTLGNGNSTTATDYSYDFNGNLTRDDNKSIQSITYNHLDLPVLITFAGTNRKINYTYTAAGAKLSKTIIDGADNGTTEYLGGFQYNNGTLQFFPTSEGYVSYTAGVPQPYDYVFNYTDHLGNVRVSYGLDPATPGNLKIYEENNYYPFGLKHSTYNNTLRIMQKAEVISESGEIMAVSKKMAISNTIFISRNVIPNSGYQYKYQSQEYQDEMGLNLYSFKWRNQDPATGRFLNVDKLAEQYHHWSPYVFGGNQVVHSRELEGLEPEEDLNQTPAGFEGGTVSEADMQSGTPMGGTLQDVVVTNSSSGSKYTNTGNYTNCGYSGKESLSNGVTNDSGNKTFGGIFDGQLEYYAKNPGPNPYSPSCDWRYSAAICAAPAIVVAAEAGAIGAAASYLWAEAATALSEVTLSSAIIGVSTNTFSQFLANGRNVGDINWIESASSIVPSFLSAGIGEYFNWSNNDGFKMPNFTAKTFVQIFGGVISHGYGKATDNYLGSGFINEVIGEYFKFQVETVSNVVPNVVK
jgi:RHS repeat-associated protein